MTAPVSDVELNTRAHLALPAEPTPLVYVFGAGPVGTAIAARLVRSGVPVAGVHGRAEDLSVAAGAASGAMGHTGELPELFDTTDVLIVSVRDSRIKEVAKSLLASKRLRRDMIVLHTSGAWPASALLGELKGHVRGVGTLHPLMSFTRTETAPELYGAAFAIEGDEAACAMAEKLVTFMGGRKLRLGAKALPLYHAGAVVASNYVVALVDLARQLFEEVGVSAADATAALVPLLRSVASNLDTAGLPDALTGPVSRGDVETVELHLKELDAARPDVAELYRRLGRETVRLAREKSSELHADALEKLTALFGGAAAAPKHKNGVAANATKKRGK